MTRKSSQGREVTALKVKQWLKEWNKVEFDEKTRRRKPEPHFYLFTLPASELKALSGIYRRTTEEGILRSEDLAIQRRHDKDRSHRIREYIDYGYPWSELSGAKRKSGEFNDLRKPGWLPTAIVINILTPQDTRRGTRVGERNAISIVDSEDSTAIIRFPHSFTGAGWHPGENQPHPIEVIDGQHRLWAFEKDDLKGDFYLPVVAFHGLDISWQAYIFWSINITPKRINASLAFDLYPLLRTEDWLERFEGHSIYRETRAQELTESLWAHPESPWHHRINMLGESGLQGRMVTQAAWIRSLMASYVKAYEGKKVRVGGLFGAPLGAHDEVLDWSRAQQAAFLILMGQKLSEAIRKRNTGWVGELRAATEPEVSDPKLDPAFAGSRTLLNTDQGIRALLHVTNDLCYVEAGDLELQHWVTDQDAGAVDEEAVTTALKSLQKHKVSGFLEELANSLATYDWRTAAADGLNEQQRRDKLIFRGSGGYKELRIQLLRHLEQHKGKVGTSADKASRALGYK